MSSIFPKVRDVWSRRTLPAKLFSFASIGVVNLGVDVTFFTLAFQFLHLPLVASNVICWMVAVTGSYAMNAKITFGQETGGVFSIERYLRFAASGILGLVISTTVLVWLSRYTNVPVAKLASIIAGFGFNFSMSHFVVFRSYRMTSKRPAVHPKRSDEPLAIVRRIKTLKTIYRTKLQPQKLLHRIFVPADERREEYFGRKMASLREWAAKNPEKPRGEILEEASRINPYFLKLSRRWVWPKDLDASLREHAKQAPPEHGIDEQALRGALALLQDPPTQERFKGLVVEELERLPDFERDLGVSRRQARPSALCRAFWLRWPCRYRAAAAARPGSS